MLANTWKFHHAAQLAAAGLALALCFGARALAAEDSRDSIRDPGELAFVREGSHWLRTDQLCLARPARALAYVVKRGGAASLHVQDKRDGTVSRVQAVGARSKVESDCAAGSCYDNFSRALAGDAGALDYKGRLGNIDGDWDYAYQVTSTLPGLGALDCAGGRLLLACVTPRWEVRVELAQQNASPVRVLYTASHLAGKKEHLSLQGGTIGAGGSSASFEHAGYLYTVTASADAKSPSASLRVERGGKKVLDEACTAYTIDAGKLAQARAAAAKR